MGIRIIKDLKYIANCFLGLIYCGEEKCIICNEDICDCKSYLCHNCLKKIKYCEAVYSFRIEEKNIECISLSHYSGIVKELILKLKYNEDFRCGEELATLILKKYPLSNTLYDFITYVPLSKEREKKRGYNQSKCIAHYLSLNSGVKNIAFLQKRIETEDQIGLSGKERWKNIKGSFEVINYKKIREKKILLVDDVITTGATAYYCAFQLLKYGAEKVTVLTAAKSSV